MFLKKDWFLSRFIIYTIVLCLFYFTQCPQTRMFWSSLSSSSSFFLRTDKNQLLLPQSEEKKAVESTNQSGTLNHTNSRRNSSLFSSQNFQNILDKTNDLPKYIHLCFPSLFLLQCSVSRQFRASFWKSIEILATQEMNVQEYFPSRCSPDL